MRRTTSSEKAANVWISTFPGETRRIDQTCGTLLHPHHPPHTQIQHTDTEQQQHLLTNSKNHPHHPPLPSPWLLSNALEIVEINAFKSLTHLSLSVRKGNDVEVKMYLAARLDAERTTTSSLRTELQRISKELQVSDENLKRVNLTLQDSNTNLKKVKDEIGSRSRQHLNVSRKRQTSVSNFCDRVTSESSTSFVIVRRRSERSSNRRPID